MSELNGYMPLPKRDAKNIAGALDMRVILLAALVLQVILVAGAVWFFEHLAAQIHGDMKGVQQEVRDTIQNGVRSLKAK